LSATPFFDEVVVTFGAAAFLLTTLVAPSAESTDTFAGEVKADAEARREKATRNFMMKD
jgi:hypothetical protein